MKGGYHAHSSEPSFARASQKARQTPPQSGDYGFSSWTKLKNHVDAGQSDAPKTEQRANQFLDLVCLHHGPDNSRGAHSFEEAAQILKDHPEIARHSVHMAAAVDDAEALREMLTDDRCSAQPLIGALHSERKTEGQVATFR